MCSLNAVKENWNLDHNEIVVFSVLGVWYDTVVEKL